MYRLQALRHYQFGATLICVVNVEFVHERPHEEDAPARAFQQVFVGEWVRDVFQPEAYPLVAHVNHEFFASQFEGDENLFAALLLASVIVGVDYALANGHADLKTIVVVETDSARDCGTHLFGETDAIEQRFESDLDPLRSSAGAVVGIVRQGGRMYNTLLPEVNVASHWMSRQRGRVQLTSVP
jgi:hypothetical protein